MNERRLQVAATIAAGMASDWNGHGPGLQSENVRRDMVSIAVAVADELIRAVEAPPFAGVASANDGDDELVELTASGFGRIIRKPHND
jgi:hypothetical protein